MWTVLESMNWKGLIVLIADVKPRGIRNTEKQDLPAALSITPKLPEAQGLWDAAALVQPC